MAVGALRHRFAAAFRTAAPTLGLVAGCTAIYFVVIAAPFFYRRDIVMGSDTHTLWSFNFAAFYSFTKLGEFMWWDPTSYNGWPAYVNETSGWFNYLSPYALPYLGFAKAAVALFNVDINRLLLVQKTIYYFVLNLTAVVLISREVITHRWARLVPPVIFSLCEIHFFGFLASAFIEALPAPLFYCYGLIRHNNRRRAGSLLLFVLLTGLLLASLNYMFLLSGLYWTTILTVAILIFYPDLPRRSFALARQLWGSPAGRWTLPVGLLFLVVAFWAVSVVVYLNVENVIRVTGDGIVNYNMGVAGNWPPPSYDIRSFQSWTNFLLWSPFRDIADFTLNFDPNKTEIDNRYLGLATLPLLLVALLRGYWNRYVLAFLLTFFVCTVFLPYTRENIVFAHLIRGTDLFKKIRWMGSSLPRTGPNILLLIVAGIGFELLLTRRTAPSGESPTEQRRLDTMMLAVFGVLLGFAGFAAVVVTLDPSLQAIRHGLGHIAVYLTAFVILCTVLAVVRDDRVRCPLFVVFLALIVMDLTIAASFRWARPAIWFSNSGASALPESKPIAPITDESQYWVGSYRGMVHGIYSKQPLQGMKTWLVLLTRPAWQPVLENWNARTNLMREYPAFRFYNVATYIPFERIHTIDSVPPPYALPTTFYIHNERAASYLNPATGGPVPVERMILEFTLNRVKVETRSPENAFMVFLDNYDRFWTAKIDGRPVPVYRANFTYKAIELPGGRHVVEWVYDPWPVRWSWYGFYVTLAVFGAVVGRWYRADRRRVLAA